MMTYRNKLELLSPALNAEVAVQAIIHGADAVYMGASNFGARKNAGNSIDDIRRVVDFAHQFRSKVYVTINTIIYEKELKQVEKLCRELYVAGVDALIVQDMGLLRLDLPPISLHASTQCDIRTVEKAKFLQDVGFSQIVLARELHLEEIKKIVDAVDIPVECFIHGALCVSYSGRCHASCVSLGRSANRGECAQLCRLPYTLIDGNGKVLAEDKYVLSLKDLNAGPMLDKLIEAGVRSFKIEGRLKDITYVKNITSYYDEIINKIIDESKGKYARSSFGEVRRDFIPDPRKSFNRGFTSYFMTRRRPLDIASLHTPKSMGEIIRNPNDLNNGDGISFFDKNGDYQGVNINCVRNGKIIPARRITIPKSAQIHRTNDIEWEKKLNKKSGERKIRLSLELDATGITANDERGVVVRLPLKTKLEKALRPMSYEKELRKMGNTPYEVVSFENNLSSDFFIPISHISALRKELVALLNETNKITYFFDKRRRESKNAVYPYSRLDYRENVSNHLAHDFYKDHGVREIDKALEINEGKDKMDGLTVMTTRHCILRELGLCLRNNRSKHKEPFVISNDRFRFKLKFDCKRCEMIVTT